MAEVKFSELPLATPLVGDEVLVGLKPSSSNSEEENVLVTVEDLTAYVLAQDSNSGGGGVSSVNTLTGAVSLNAGYIGVKGADIASAATVDLATATGDWTDITGSTGPVTSFGAVAAGVERLLRFISTPTITHNGTSLILPTAANIVAAAGDWMRLRSLGSGNWVCVAYQRADGSALVGGGGATNLDDLGDVDAPSPSDGDVLTFDSGTGDWVPEAPSGGGGGGGGYGPDIEPSSPDAMDDEFPGSSLDGIWTWFNQGTSTAVVNQSNLLMTSPIEASGQIRGIEQTHSGPARYRARIAGINLSNFNLSGIYFRNTSNSRIMAFDTSRVSGTYAVDYFSSASAYSSSPFNATTRAGFEAERGYVYAELEDDGTNLIARMSATGVNGTYELVLSVTRASYIGTPDRIGIHVYSGNASRAGIAVVDWFRKMA